MTILIIAPHPDDEILGCGATMARLIEEGNDVQVVIASNASIGAPELFSKEGHLSVRQEALEAHKLLGVSKTYFLDFPAPALNAFPEYKISLRLSEIFEEVKPHHLYLPHPSDLHQDHKAIYRAALVAARPQNSCSITGIFCYETLSETEWAPVLSNNFFIPTRFVDVTLYFERKLAAMQCFKSQLKDFPHSRSIEALTALASYRGATVGISKAEVFAVERIIESDT